MVDLTLSDSFENGRYGAHHVYSSAEEVPSFIELVSNHTEYLQTEYPKASESELVPLAESFARGWLSVAAPLRAEFLAEKAQEIEAEWRELEANGRSAMGDEAWEWLSLPNPTVSNRDKKED
jgi:hypothetical protein